MRDEFGQLLIVGNLREEALSILREIIGKPLVVRTPRSFRLDPIWSRLADDPRFDQILNSAKAL